MYWRQPGNNKRAFSHKLNETKTTVSQNKQLFTFLLTDDSQPKSRINIQLGRWDQNRRVTRINAA